VNNHNLLNPSYPTNPYHKTATAQDWTCLAISTLEPLRRSLPSMGRSSARVPQYQAAAARLLTGVSTQPALLESGHIVQYQRRDGVLLLYPPISRMDSRRLDLNPQNIQTKVLCGCSSHENSN
jgi:hypothetical protein